MGGSWDASKIPDLKGKVVIVTGANSGIGEASAIELAKKGAEVILACRDAGRGKAAEERMKKAVGETAKVKFLQLDLSSFESIKSFTQTFKSQYKDLDILVNNAGLMYIPYSTTKEGFETQFGVNHIGTFVLTSSLMDYLLKKKGSRIVNVSSEAHRQAKVANFEDAAILSPPEEKYGRLAQYCTSKASNILFTNELYRRLKEKGKEKDLIVNSCHPGWTATELQSRAVSDSFFLKHLEPIMNKIFAMKPEMGCLSTLYAAVEPTAEGGKYYGPSGYFGMSGYPAEAKTEAFCQEEALMKSLWEKTETMAKMKFNLP